AITCSVKSGRDSGERTVISSASTTRKRRCAASHAGHERTCAAIAAARAGSSVPSTYASSSGSHQEQRTRPSLGRHGALFDLAQFFCQRNLPAMDQRLHVAERQPERAGDRMIFHVVEVA